MPLPTGTTVRTAEEETAKQSSGSAPVSSCSSSILCIDTHDGSASIRVCTFIIYQCTSFHLQSSAWYHIHWLYQQVHVRKVYCWA